MIRLLLLLSVLFLLPALNAADRPNVVMLLADDLGYRDIGCYDGPVKTPALDELSGSLHSRNFISILLRVAPRRPASASTRAHPADWTRLDR